MSHGHAVPARPPATPLQQLGKRSTHAEALAPPMQWLGRSAKAEPIGNNHIPVQSGTFDPTGRPHRQHRTIECRVSVWILSASLPAWKPYVVRGDGTYICKYAAAWSAKSAPGNVCSAMCPLSHKNPFSPHYDGLPLSSRIPLHAHTHMISELCSSAKLRSR